MAIQSSADRRFLKDAPRSTVGLLDRFAALAMTAFGRAGLGEAVLGGPQMASQGLEKIKSAPGIGMTTEASKSVFRHGEEQSDVAIQKSRR